ARRRRRWPASSTSSCGPRARPRPATRRRGAAGRRVACRAAAESPAPCRRPPYHDAHALQDLHAARAAGPRGRVRASRRRLVAARAMVDLARVHGLGTLLAPVRPADKSAYPLAPMERYARWQNDDGLPMDRWIRVHARMGADILAVAPRTLLITGSVEEWERWTDLRFPDSGSYVVPGALQPVVIDRNADEGRYEDPNVWMRHTIE